LALEGVGVRRQRPGVPITSSPAYGKSRASFRRHDSAPALKKLFAMSRLFD
jgi:hypothetical protein